MFINRTLQSTIERVSKIFQVILLSGMRQIGKNTLFELLEGDGRTYVSLDNLEARALAQSKPELFIQRYRPPVMIAEIQYAPELFTYIKNYADKDKYRQKALFLLTSSLKTKQLQHIQEGLAGRMVTLAMLGLSFKEIANRAEEVQPYRPSSTELLEKKMVLPLQLYDLYRLIFNGSFPQVIAIKGRKEFYNAYLQSYIERDVRDFYDISNKIKFYNFIRAVAVRTGNLLNYSELSRDADIDLRTAKTWLTILERSGMVKLLYPYPSDNAKRMVKTPKLYFLDTGLCAHLAGIDTVQMLEASYLTHSILKTYAFCEILKSYWHNGLERNLYFYRDNDQKEIDFLIETGGKLYPIDVKKTVVPTQNEINNFKILKKLQKPIGQGAILCLTSEYVSLSEDVNAEPIWDIA